jgi:hypothetical protein
VPLAVHTPSLYQGKVGEDTAFLLHQPDLMDGELSKDIVLLMTELLIDLRAEIVQY